MEGNPPANLGGEGDEKDAGLIPGSGRSPGIGNGNPLQYSCLENPTDRGAWLATVHGVTKSRTRLSVHVCTHTHTHTHTHSETLQMIQPQRILWHLFRTSYSSEDESKPAISSGQSFYLIFGLINGIVSAKSVSSLSWSSVRLTVSYDCLLLPRASSLSIF